MCGNNMTGWRSISVHIRKRPRKVLKLKCWWQLQGCYSHTHTCTHNSEEVRMLLVLLRLLGTSTKCLRLRELETGTRKIKQCLIYGVKCVTEQGNRSPQKKKTGLTAGKVREISYTGSPIIYSLWPSMLQTGESAEALATAFGDLLWRVDCVGNKSTLDTLPAVLDLDVPITY